MFLTPRKQSFSNILINATWSLIAWVIWSFLIIICIFFLSNYLHIFDLFDLDPNISQVSPIFPFLISITTLLGTTLASFLTYFLLNMTDPEKYKKNRVLFWQIAFYQILCYILITPLYIYSWFNDFENIMIVYVFQVLLIIFWTSLILEIFNNYRYILIWLYGTIIGLFICVIFATFVYTTLASSNAKIIMLIVILPLANFIVIFLKQIFELVYYYYYKWTSYDPLGDISYQIELEEERKAEEEEEKNSI